MRVKIEHLIPHIEKRISALELQVVEDQAEDLRLKQEYESKFFPKLFGWKYEGVRGYWFDTSEQRLVKEKRNWEELKYLLKNKLDTIVRLSTYINEYSKNYIKVKDAILKEHGEIND